MGLDKGMTAFTKFPDLVVLEVSRRQGEMGSNMALNRVILLFPRVATQCLLETLCSL